MPRSEIGNFAAFASLLVAGCRLGPGADPSAIAAAARSLPSALAATAAEIARAAEDHALHFTHPGRARDDAIAVFFQVAPAALADPAVFAAPVDPERTAERMIRAIHASPLGRDFRETILAEPFFRGVAEQALRLMQASRPDEG